MATRQREPIIGRAADNSGVGNLDEIKELLDVIIEKGVSEFELERSGFRIKIARNCSPLTIETATASAAVSASIPSKAVQPQALNSTSPAVGAQNQPATAEQVHIVRSPMVGTFYAAPADGAEPFVRVGDRMQAGQVLCIIEAMKLMNEIEAETAGEVIKCYVENGQPVEYGEPLFDVRPLTPVKR